MHTALHLLCAVVPMGVTGGQIGELKSRLDFNADASTINKEEIQEKLNQILKNDHEITYQWIKSDELEKKPELVRTMSVKPPKTDEKIRLVKIGKIDLQPCGGTHVKNTSEISSITIGKIENKGRMNRRINISLSD
jgi:misacylated tRNA(Ala) deacylase